MFPAEGPRALAIWGVILTVLVSMVALPFIVQASAAVATSVQPLTTQNGPSAPYFDHVVVIVMEDHGTTNICGLSGPPCSGSSSPFLSQLANKYGMSYNYVAVYNVSQPNYLAILGGSIFGCTHSGCPTNIPNSTLVDSLESKGLTWKAYMENQNVPAGCDTTTQEPYQREHNPFSSFQDIVNNPTRCNKIVLANPSNCSVTDCTLIDDLNSASAANFMWLTPNDCNNMHSASVCSNGCTSSNATICIADGDSYLSSLVPTILGSYTFTTQRAALFITFDEGNNYCQSVPTNRNCVYALWAGPQVQQTTSNVAYSHYSFLKTVESNWGLGNLTSNDGSATAMAGFFNNSIPLPTPVSWNSRVNCAPKVTTIEQLLGNQTNSNGGAVESNSTFSPGVTSPLGPNNAKSWLTNSSVTPKNWTSPGLDLWNNSANCKYFVQIDGVQRGFFSETVSNRTFMPINGGTLYPNGLQNDTSFSIFTPGYTTCDSTTKTACMHGLIAAIDHDWKGASYCGPNTTCDRSALRDQTAALSSLIDVQGFLFWNATSSNDPGHYYSGWELHSLTAWRKEGQQPGITLSANPTTLTIVPGHSAISNITISGFNLFAGKANLTAAVTPLSGTAPPSPGTSFTPLTVNLTPDGIAFSKLNVTTGATTTGSYSITIGAINKTLSALPVTLSALPITISVTMVGYTLSAAASDFSILPGASVNTNITVTSQGSFQGPVTLTVLSSCGCALPTLASSTLILKAGRTNSTTLHIAASGNGDATITVNATSTAPSFSATTTLSVRVSDFGFTSAQSFVNVDAGTVGSTTLLLSSINHFNGTINLSATTSPNGPAPIFNSTRLTLHSGQTLAVLLSFNSTRATNYVVTVTAANGTLSHQLSVTFIVVDFNLTSTQSVSVNVGSTGTTTVTLSSLNGFTGSVALTNSTSPSGISWSISPISAILNSGGASSTTLTFVSSVVGNYTVTITGSSGPLTHRVSIKISVVDFSILAGPVTPAQINVGSPGNSTITLTGQNGFTGTVTLSVSPSSPSGLICTLPASAILPPLQSTGILSCKANIAGDYTVTVLATNLGLSHSTTPITFHIVDFNIISFTSSLTLTAGSNSPNNIIQLTSLNGFTGTVILSSSSSGTGPSATLAQSSLLLKSGGQNATTVTISAGSFAGKFNITITGTNGALSRSTIITLTVTPASTTITTTLSSISIPVGGAITDSASLGGPNVATATGNVNYTVFSNGACTSPGIVFSTAIVTKGVVPSSRSIVINATGSFSFNATYSGDANNNPAAGTCEPLTVTKTNPTISTTLSSTTINVGAIASDSASLAGGFNAGGTVQYEVYSNGACTAPFTIASNVNVTGSVIPNSRAITFNATGSYAFQAVYSGDSNNNGATSGCEVFTVQKITPTITTALSAVSIIVGNTATDSATLIGGFQPSGTVTYSVFANGVCNPLGTGFSTVTASSGVVPSSRAVLFNSTGLFSFNAAYSGDANNNGLVSSCEQLTVQKSSPTIATSLSSASPAVGTTVTDSSTIASAYNAGGTVVYNVFPNGACTSPGTAVSMVAVVGGAVPNSRPVTFNSTGSFSFTAVYSGDANNNGAASGCEPLTVVKATPTITTTLSSASIIVGGVAYDSAILTAGYNAGGIVTYAVFSNGLCAPVGSIVSTVTMTGGTVPNSRLVLFNSTGNYAFQANYLGDNNNNGASSSCEPLSVGTKSVTITTTLSSTAIFVGQSDTDSAALSGETNTAGGTVQYELFTISSCAGSPSTVSTVTVTNGVVPRSRPITFNSTGTVGFTATYSGDNNNSPATSSCEALAVNKATPSLATSLSATTITVPGSVNDSSSLTGGYQPAGTVTYQYFTGSACTGTSTVVATPVQVVNGVVPTSASQLFASAGVYTWNAVYSGDGDNTGTTSLCELLTVNKTSPTITTSLSSALAIVGTSVTDASTIANGFQASGNVTYNEFNGATCGGTTTIVSTVIVTNGIVPNSASVSPTPAGSYSFNAAYSGDANNNLATSACEPLTMNKASPTVTTTLAGTAITVGTTTSDSSILTGYYQAGGTVQYDTFPNGACTAPFTIASIGTVTNGVASNSRAVLFNLTGSYAFQSVYSGDVNNNAATSPCESLTVNKTNPSISTTLSTSTIVIGSSVTDSATLGSFYQASGTVTYGEFPDASCAGTATPVSTVTVTNGVIPNSSPVTPTTAGSYSFDASYSGDVNNKGATSPCEALTVQKASPTIASSLPSGSIIVGASSIDSATLTNGFNAAGTVTYSVFMNGVCNPPGIAASNMQVSNGIVPNSRPVVFNATGSYGFQAVYSGDSSNNGATSLCEALTVNKISPTIATSLSANTVVAGASVTDSATLSGGFNAGGTVTYQFFSGSGCTGSATIVGTPVTVTGGIVSNSAPETQGSAGTYGWNAVYSGDSNNNAAQSTCEPLTVQRDSPTITAILTSNTITVGGSATDSANLTGAFQAGGTVTYEYFTGSSCSGTPTGVGGLVTVTNNIVPGSASQAFNSAGSYSWNAVYSGDANNNGATSPCEPLTVTKANPTLTTVLSSTSIQAGQSVVDSASLVSFFQAGGTVTYNVFANGACTSPGIVASTVTVSTGVVPNSRLVKFNATGSYSFLAAYGGDPNNTGATSGCETLAVNPNSGIGITTSLSSGSIFVGTSATDSASLSGAVQASGTVAYSVFSNGACISQGTTVSIVGVTNNVVPSARAVFFNATGTYSFQATYSGDANNSPATSPCEPLTVQKVSPTLTTSLSPSTIVVGNSVTDSATLTGAYAASGTVTYEYFSGNTCTGTATPVGSPVAVVSGLVPSSPSQTFSSAGSYSWNATYSGDANNSAATSACEPLTVSKASPTISTTLSSNTPVVGTGITDSATLTNGFTAAGTVTYNAFSNGVCTPPLIVASTVTVIGGTVPDSPSVVFNSTGTYSFQAAYSGNANNNPASSICELLIVQKVSPTITTSLSSVTPLAGTSISDSAFMIGGFQASGTVTYAVFANGACTGSGSIASIVNVTNGVIPDSRQVTFNATGPYGFRASYTGDPNNNSANNGCEPLSVQKTNPTISTLLSSSTPIVGTTISDSATLSGGYKAGGTVTYTVFANSFCGSQGSIASIVNVVNGAVPNSRGVQFNSTGAFSFQTAYSGDSNNSPTLACEPLTVQPATPTIATTLTSTTIIVGGSTSDSASLANGYKAGGTVTYQFFVDSTCSSSPTTVGSPVAVTNGVVPGSTSQSFTSAGTFSWDAVYSGDSNNNPATSPCEPLAVSKTSPTISTILSSTTPIVGSVVTDSATLAGGYNAAGTVTYSVFSNGACSGTATAHANVTMTAGSVPNSPAIAFNATGSYSFTAAYSGDSNNNPSGSTCEPLSVQKASPALATSISATNPIVGTSITDSASISGGFNPSGTVLYTMFSNGGCTSPGSTVSTVTTSAGIVPNSRAVSVNSTGAFSFQATYSGDSNNNAAISTCEPLNVQKTTPTIATTLSSTAITVGKTTSDSSSISSAYKASGSVTYYLFAGGTCSGTPTLVSQATISNGIVPDSRNVQLNSTGSFSFNAVYSGDANNSQATSTCEPLNVGKTTPILTTSLSSTSITVGTTGLDSASIANTFQAGGTVNYTIFATASCTGSGNLASAVIVTNGQAPSSRAVTFNSTGSFSFQASYSGDSNNNPATSSCEPLTVNKTSPSITTTLSSNIITVGNSATDSASLTGTFNATGTVTYQFFTGNTCSGTPSTVGSPVTVANGSAPNSQSQTFDTAGAYSWNAIYSGDSNNSGATSSCEALTVNKTTPTLTTTLSTTPIIVGSSTTDSASLANSLAAGGIVSYTVFPNNACSSPGTVASKVTVAGGAVPNSRAIVFNSTGTYSFNAVYGGDPNNNAATSACEPLTVNKASPTISTVLSSTSIQVGQFVTDSAALTSSYQATGIASYVLFIGSSACIGASSPVSSVTVINGVIPDSRNVKFNSTNTGGYSFQVLFSGDANNNGATSGCEPLTVSAVGVSITTSLSATTIVVGGSVIDSATLHSQTATAGGTVTYSYFANGNCAGSGTVESTVTVTNGAVPDSAAVTFNTAGSLSFNAVYSGDANNGGATSPCEPLTVAKASPTLSLSLSSATITVGSADTGSAALSGGFNAGGTVTYQYFTGSTCAGTPATVGPPVIVSNGSVPNSASQTFDAAGSYSWTASYSGDTDNNGSISSCQSMLVAKASPILTTLLSATSITVGTAATDSASLNGGFQAGGTVTYNIFTNGACNPPGSIVSTATVTSNIAPNSRTVVFNATGPFSFDAIYSGDINNNAASSPCEPLAVNRATPVITTVVSPSSTIVVGNPVGDQASISAGYPTSGVSGTMTYYFFGPGDPTCTGTFVASQTVSVGPGNSVPSFNPPTIIVSGQYSFNATYNGDAFNNAATSSCESLAVIKTSPALTTNLSATTVRVGTSATDSAILANSFSAGGMIVYVVFSDGACATVGSQVSSVAVTNGLVPSSRAVTFNATGSYSFQATYNGDSNNNGATSSCEPMSVQKVNPTLSTSLSSQTTVAGGAIFDGASLSGGFQSGGTVTYTVFGNGACTSPGTSVSIVAIVSGSIAASRTVVFNATGSYSFQAAYSGDSNNNGASSPCEPLTVMKASLAIATSLSASSITIGQSATDSATLTGGFQTTGTVSYYFFSTSSSCGATATLIVTVNVGAGGSVPSSTPLQPPGTGTVSFDAVYSGDSNNNQATSACEQLTVAKATPIINASLSATPVTVGQSVANLASLTGGYPSTGVTGTVTYSYFASSGSCSGPSSATTVAVGPNDSVPSSTSITQTVAGSFSFNAIYSGDANNNGITSSCEPLIVQKASPTITTTLSSPTVAVGSNLFDSASMNNGYNAGGTLSYTVFSGLACTPPGSIASTVSVASNSIPNSRAVTFNATGSYSIQASYSGDSNNNPTASSCEPLTVQKVTPTISTTLSAATITVGGSATDSATLTGGFQPSGTVTYEYFSGGACAGTAGTVGNPVSVTNGLVPSSSLQPFTTAGSFSWNAQYSGDASNNGATSTCEPLTVQRTTPTIVTSLSPTTTQVGQSVTDSAILSNTFQAGGTVTYSLFTNVACNSPGSAISIVTVTSGQVPGSRSVVFNATGSYSFHASYSGDSNNNPTTSGCEPLPVNPVGVAVTTTLSATSITVGGSVFDTATLTGQTITAGGTVTYDYFSNGNCATPAVIVSTAIVTNGIAPSSAAQTFNSAGTFSWNAVYSGDTNNNGATSGCEPLQVNKANPSISTTLSASTPIVGTTITDSSTLSGGYSASGAVTYALFTNGACLSPGGVVSTLTVSNGVVPTSRPITLNSTGSYSFLASYSGDSNNNGASSPCEPFTALRASPVISTSLSGGTITVTGSVQDTATLTGGFLPGGTVTYEYFAGSLTCTGIPTIVGTQVTVISGVVPDSAPQQFNSAGLFSWNAAYSGDSNNNLATSSCEPLTVNKASPLLATSLSASGLVVGGSVSDAATMTGAYNAAGSVTYEFFAGATCSGTPTIVGSPVAVGNSVIPSSSQQTFSSAGSYSWNALYSGDSNNNGATSPCEFLTVSRTSPSLTTSLSQSTLLVGTSVTDSASLSGSFNAAGTVAYMVFTNGVCANPGTVVTTVTVAGGSVPTSRSVLFNSTGSFSFNAAYNGDANNNAAVSTCEPLSVNKASPVVASSLSSTSITVGQSVTASASFSNDYQASGTLTYSLFNNGACAAPGTVVSAVTVASGTAPVSRAVIFNQTGTYGLQAVYSGDANNNGATSGCDALAVNPKGVNVSTSLSSTSISVGGSASDSATLASQTANAGGTVTYVVFANAGCSAPGNAVSTVTVTNGAVTGSRVVMFNSTGTYGFQAVYSGDANNNPATSACETLTVNKAVPAIATSLSATSITVGGSVSDSAALSGEYNAGGTVTYRFFTGSTCTGTATVAGSAVTVVNGVVPSSASQGFAFAGSFSWNAAYSGDSNNSPAASSCEPLTVQKASTGIATSLSTTSPVVGTSVIDSASLTNSFNAGGTVIYSVFANGVCTGQGVAVSSVTVTTGSVPDSRAVTFNSTGSFSFDAGYGGDANNPSAISLCEPLTVQKVSPIITTALTPVASTVGGSVSDSSTLISSYKASGTVIYEYFTGPMCSGTATTVGAAVTVAGGLIPSSSSQVFNSAGSYSWDAVYSGDSNNNGATSSCESLVVNKANPTLSSALSSTTINTGASVTDIAILTGGFQAGGSVTYTYFVGGSCAGIGTQVGAPVSVTNGAVPASSAQIFGTAGSYGWNAVYSGDINNNPTSVTLCQKLTVLSPPRLSVPGSLTVGSGSTVHFVVNATDADPSKTITLTASGLPAGASFSSVQSFAGGASSAFSWTPSNGEAPGDYNITFTANDGQGDLTVAHTEIHVTSPSKTAPLPLLSYSIFGLVGFLAVLGVAIILRRLQSPARKRRL